MSARVTVLPAETGRPRRVSLPAAGSVTILTLASVSSVAAPEKPKSPARNA